MQKPDKPDKSPAEINMHNSEPGNYHITPGQTSEYLDMHFCPLTCIDSHKHSKIKIIYFSVNYYVSGKLSTFISCIYL